MSQAKRIGRMIAMINGNALFLYTCNPSTAERLRELNFDLLNVKGGQYIFVCSPDMYSCYSSNELSDILSELYVTNKLIL